MEYQDKPHLPLYDTWKLWLHYPNDQNWGYEGEDHYQEVMTFETVQDVLSANERVQDSLIQQCMVFVMKDDIRPIWEDPANRDGGRFSFKIPNHAVPDIWRKLLLHMTCHNITKPFNEEFEQSINGISISPKKAFCIIKLWMKDCKQTDVSPVVDIKGLNKDGCIFKKNMPE